MSFLPAGAQAALAQAKAMVGNLADQAGVNLPADPIAIQLEKANEAVDVAANAAAAVATGPMAAVMGQKLKYEYKKNAEAARVQGEQAEAPTMQLAPYLMNISTFTQVPGVKDNKPVQIGYFCVQIMRRPENGAAPVVEWETFKRFGDFKDVHNLLKHHLSDHAFNLLNGADTIVKVAQGGLFPSGGMPWADKTTPAFLTARMTAINAWLAQITSVRVRACVQAVLRDFAREGQGKTAAQQYEASNANTIIVNNMKHAAKR